ncbi:MAG: hypothetical protein HDR88_13970 [Bacteroides sp.]|nr:hypothetical protein [Bacteroides sp.]
MKRNILTKLFCLAFVALLSFSAYAQEKIYLVKDGKIIATYSTAEVDYLTFDSEGLITNDDFEITIDELDYRYVVWTVKPQDPDMYYYTGVYTEESIRDRFNNSVEEMASTLYSDMSFLAGMVGVSVDEFMESSVLYKGETQIGYDQIGPGSDYVLVAFGCNPDGTATTKTYTGLNFSTPAMPSTGLTVDFNITAGTNDVTIEYCPSDDSVRYFTEVREYGENFDMQDWMNTLIWRGSISGMSPEEVVAENTYFGKQTLDYSLEPEYEYVVYACSVTDDGVINSEVSSKTFVSGPVAMSENTFELSVSDIGSLTATFNVTPSNNDSYSIGVLPLSDFEGRTDQEVLEEYVMYNAWPVEYNTRSGEASIEWSGLRADTEYVFFAFGYYHNTLTTEMSKVTFTTLPTSDPKTWEATFGEVTFGDYFGDPAAYVQINVNQDDIQYVWQVVESTGTAEQIHEALLRECERYEGMGINYVEMRGIYGSNEVSFSGMEEGVEYKFFAVVMNPETYEFETEVFFSENFTMPSDAAKMPALKVAKSQADNSSEKDAKANEKVVIKNVLKL